MAYSGFTVEVAEGAAVDDVDELDAAEELDELQFVNFVARHGSMPALPTCVSSSPIPHPVQRQDRWRGPRSGQEVCRTMPELSHIFFASLAAEQAGAHKAPAEVVDMPPPYLLHLPILILGLVVVIMVAACLIAYGRGTVRGLRLHIAALEVIRVSGLGTGRMVESYCFGRCQSLPVRLPYLHWILGCESVHRSQDKAPVRSVNMCDRPPRSTVWWPNHPGLTCAL
jgi:hypothetical protein